MNAKNPLENLADPSAGAIPGMCRSAAAVLLFALLVTLGLATSLMLTLPHVLDAVASPTPVASVDAVQRDERHPGQVVADWIDVLSESERATWRLRSSD